MHAAWCREAYERSITARAWAGTPYDAGWEGGAVCGEDVATSEELQAIFADEMALGEVPAWAVEIIERMIGPLPMCGHYAFPLPFIQVCEAIAAERAPAFVISCYTADAPRKRLLSSYVFCLDAWLHAAPPEMAKAELAMRGDLMPAAAPPRDWDRIIDGVYDALGAPTPEKRLLVRRLVHRLRWWVKTLVWHDDRRDRFLLDFYGGDVRGDAAKWGCYGNSPFGDPYFAEREVPEMAEVSCRIRETIPGGPKLLERIEDTWLCAPKVFRYVEKLIIEIGAIGSAAPPAARSIFPEADTRPDIVSYAERYAAFTASLAGWLRGDASYSALMGEPMPVKRWLVRLFLHKLRLYEKHNTFGLLVGARK